MTTKPQISQQFSLSNISSQRLQISLLHDLDSNKKIKLQYMYFKMQYSHC